MRNFVNCWDGRPREDGMVQVKICGITNPEDALFAAELGADALGLIFYNESPRYVSPECAAEIVAGLPPFVTPVGVFVNEVKERTEEIVRLVGLRAIQLHGDEPPEACSGYSIPVIRAVRVGDELDLDELSRYPVETFLLDTARAGLYGGTGEPFDWSVARNASSARRIILSGGIDPENVAAAIGAVQPYGVDSSSGVEAAPGRKDHQKLTAFFEAVRSVDGR